MKEKFIVKEATLNDADKIGEVFDLYRQFYKQPSDITACTQYISDRLKNKEATIFFIENDGGACLGFTQLYITFDSVRLSKKIILYDLYVRSEYRKKGIARILMNTAKSFAQHSGVGSIELSTAKDNKIAQSLYESLSYERDNKFYSYDLSI